MDVVYARCAGLDVHQKTVVACVRLQEPGGVTHEVRSFGTSTRELLELVDWLASHGCTHVAMESTGVYWKPVWHVLEGSVGPAPVLRRPGRRFHARRCIRVEIRAMSEHPADRRSTRVLEPVERISEVLFGLIMVLSITGSLSVAEAGREDVRTMLIGALGCNIAWGLIDAIMYLMDCLSRQAEGIRTVLAVRRAAQPEEAHRVIAGALPPVVAPVFQPADLERVRLHLNQLPEPTVHSRLEGRDWWGALGVFLLVFLVTLPVVLPFVFVREPMRALRFSNGIAVGMLFLSGCAYGHATGYRPWATGIAMVGVGCVLVGVTVTLGG